MVLHTETKKCIFIANKWIQLAQQERLKLTTAVRSRHS